MMVFRGRSCGTDCEGSYGRIELTPSPTQASRIRSSPIGQQTTEGSVSQAIAKRRFGATPPYDGHFKDWEENRATSHRWPQYYRGPARP